MQKYGRRQANVVLGIIAVVVAVNYLDRYVLAILVEPIKAELRLSDTQIGLLTGAAFAILYSTLALPIARLAERKSRVTIVAIAIAVWSVATLTCGFATGFLTLLLARVLVGCGEAGAMPASLSLLSDIFPAKNRGRAMAVFGLGGAVGSAGAPMIGGFLESWLGWRGAFVAMGCLGLPLLVAFFALVREPARGLADGSIVEHTAIPLGDTLRRLFSRVSFSLLIPALILMALAEYSLFLWLPAFVHRSFGLSPSLVGAKVALYQGIPFILGTLAGGFTSDRLCKRDERWIVWIPGMGALLSAPAILLLFSAHDQQTVFLLLTVPSFVGGLYVAPCYALVQNLSAAHSRATATAILAFAVNLIGAGLGPLLIGSFSDALRSTYGDESLRIAFFSLLPMYGVAAVLFYWISLRLRADLTDARRDQLGQPATA
jgi:predicted MFS family arabinose efflux permease